MTDFLAASEWSQTAGELAADGWLLADLCGLDRTGLGEWDTRFAIIVQLLHHERRERQTIHVDCDGDPPTVASCIEFWPTANFMEREAYDLFGIVFDGHPDLTRILLPDDWEGHPLRKDYGVGKVAIEFVRQPVLQIDPPGQSSKGAEADVAVDHLGQAGPPDRGSAATEDAP